MVSLWIRSGYDVKVEMSAETYQVGAHFECLMEAILVAPLKSFERFFRISSSPAGLCVLLAVCLPPDPDGLPLHVLLAAESAKILGALGHLHLLDDFPQRGAITSAVLADDSDLLGALGL